MHEPAPIEIVESIAWEGALTVLAAESGTGKTFVQLSLAACVSDAVPWLGRETQQGSVVYVSYEGDALGLRLRALHDGAGHRLEHVYIVRAHAPLSPIVMRDAGEQASRGELALRSALETLGRELADAGRPPVRLVMIDTVRASLAGSEDASDSVSAYLRAVRRVTVAAPEASLVLAHHAGWQDGRARRRSRAVCTTPPCRTAGCSASLPRPRRSNSCGRRSSGQTTSTCF
jgi:RecA-family ATPase